MAANQFPNRTQAHKSRCREIERYGGMGNDSAESDRWGEGTEKQNAKAIENK